MKYLIPCCFLAASLILTGLTAVSLYFAFTDNIYWLFVAVGIGFSSGMAVVSTTAAFDAVKHW